MATLEISSQAVETESDVKKMAKKKDERDGHEYEVKMVGDEVKWACDMCEYMGGSSKAVKSHWTKKHRRAVQEEEAKTRGEILAPENDEKRAKEDEESDEEFDDEELYAGFDEDGNRIETVEDEDENNVIRMDTKETLTTTEEDVDMMKQELETKKAEVESLKEAMTVRMDLLTLAEGKVASLEIEKVELERELRKGKKIITTLR